MEFNSLKEYFYKLRNALYFTLLIPLASFTILYLNSDQGLLEEEQSSLIISFLLFLMMFDWIIGIVLFSIKLKKIRRQPSLRQRLKEYYSLTIVRSCINIVACLMPAIGFLLTNDITLAYGFAFTLVLFFAFWPRSAKVCQDLKLKGDEYEMVFYRKDSF